MERIGVSELTNMNLPEVFEVSKRMAIPSLLGAEKGIYQNKLVNHKDRSTSHLQLVLDLSSKSLVLHEAHVKGSGPNIYPVLHFPPFLVLSFHVEMIPYDLQ